MENVRRKMEKRSFALFGNKKKTGGVENREKIFSPRPTNFFLPNREESNERKLPQCSFTVIPHSGIKKKKKKEHRERERWSKKRGKNESRVK